MELTESAVRARWSALVATAAPFCPVPGCEAAVVPKHRGLCPFHYRRWHKRARRRATFTRTLPDPTGAELAALAQN